MSSRSPEILVRLFESREVVELRDIKAALGDVSRATAFRYLKQVPYHRSYNYNGRYYTRRDPTLYDRFGLFAYGDILFSREGPLGETISRFVRESEAGWTQRELQEVLRVRVQVILQGLIRQGVVARDKAAGFYVYLHPDPSVREEQLHQRFEQIASRKRAVCMSLPEVEDFIVIQVLLSLIRHSGATAADVVRYLYGHSPPITMEQVRAVFDRYDLDRIGEKGGSCSS